VVLSDFFQLLLEHLQVFLEIDRLGSIHLVCEFVPGQFVLSFGGALRVLLDQDRAAVVIGQLLDAELCINVVNQAFELDLLFDEEPGRQLRITQAVFLKDKRTIHV